MGIEVITKAPGVEIRETVANTESKPKRSKSPKSETAPRAKTDIAIWGIYLLLLVISVIELFSASSSQVSATNVYKPLIEHVMYLAFGLGIVLFFQHLHYVKFAKWAWIVAGGAFLLLLGSNLFGVNINGAVRAIRVFGFTIQPAEIVKLAAVLLLANILSKNQEPGGVTLRGAIWAVSAVAVLGVALIKNGTTNTIILMTVSLAMFMIGGIRLKRFINVAIVYVFLAVIFFGAQSLLNSGDEEFEQVKQEQMAASEQKGEYISNVSSENDDNVDSSISSFGRFGTAINRLKRHLEGVHPGDENKDDYRQAALSRYAMANGGLSGRGPGNSRESARLPLAFSDYIYSIIVEDTGFIGGVGLLVLYLLLIARAGYVAYHCKRAFPAFLIMGCAVLIVFQALVHMTIATGLGPVSGQPLPLISKGGTSVVVMSAAIGMMLSVSRHAVTTDDKHANRAELKELPVEMQAANYSEYNIQ